MTQPRTIHRRNARKRAKVRVLRPGISWAHADWLVRDAIDETRINLRAVKIFSRKDVPHIWIQWKGTDVCCDIRCACGENSHFDGDFFYFFQCPACKAFWEVGTHVKIYPSTEERAGITVNHPANH